MDNSITMVFCGVITKFSLVWPNASCNGLGSERMLKDGLNAARGCDLHASTQLFSAKFVHIINAAFSCDLTRQRSYELQSLSYACDPINGTSLYDLPPSTQLPHGTCLYTQDQFQRKYKNCCI